MVIGLLCVPWLGGEICLMGEGTGGIGVGKKKIHLKSVTIFLDNNGAALVR